MVTRLVGLKRQSTKHPCPGPDSECSEVLELAAGPPDGGGFQILVVSKRFRIHWLPDYRSNSSFLGGLVRAVPLGTALECTSSSAFLQPSHDSFCKPPSTL